MKAYLQLLDESGVSESKASKEAGRLEMMSDKEGNIDKMEFMVYAKKSVIFKMLVSEGEGQQSQDKAEIAFKVKD